MLINFLFLIDFLLTFLMAPQSTLRCVNRLSLPLDLSLMGCRHTLQVLPLAVYLILHSLYNFL